LFRNDVEDQILANAFIKKIEGIAMPLSSGFWYEAYGIEAIWYGIFKEDIENPFLY